MAVELIEACCPIIEKKEYRHINKFGGTFHLGNGWVLTREREGKP
jgi:hypothetical protein